MERWPPLLDTGGRRHVLSFRRHRFWELAGCATAGASLDQFQQGTGWRRSVARHPNCPDERERARREKYSDDFGFGVMYWKKRCGGRGITIASRPLQEGHSTSIANKNYKRVGPEGDARNMPAELDLNYDLEQVARRLEIAHLL